MAIDTNVSETLKNQKHESMRWGGSPEPSCQLPTTPAHTCLIPTKRCSKCKDFKQLSDFYKHSSKKDGFQSYCKSCQRIYNQTEKVKAYQILYGQTKKGKARNKRFNTHHPNQIKAKNTVNNAIQAGKLPRPDTLFCTYCYEMAQHYHHPDYSKPLKVIPLCRKCHTRIHSPV